MTWVSLWVGGAKWLVRRRDGESIGVRRPRRDVNRLRRQASSTYRTYRKDHGDCSKDCLQYDTPDLEGTPRTRRRAGSRSPHRRAPVAGLPRPSAVSTRCQSSSS